MVQAQALIISCEKYTKDSKYVPLTCSHREAKQVKEALGQIRGMGRSVIWEKDPDTDAFLRVVKQLLASRKPVKILYFAGHCFCHDGETFMLPVGPRPGDPQVKIPSVEVITQKWLQPGDLLLLIPCGCRVEYPVEEKESYLDDDNTALTTALCGLLHGWGSASFSRNELQSLLLKMSEVPGFEGEWTGNLVSDDATPTRNQTIRRQRCASSIWGPLIAAAAVGLPIAWFAHRKSRDMSMVLQGMDYTGLSIKAWSLDQPLAGLEEMVARWLRLSPAERMVYTVDRIFDQREIFEAKQNPQRYEFAYIPFSQRIPNTSQGELVNVVGLPFNSALPVSEQWQIARTKLNKPGSGPPEFSGEMLEGACLYEVIGRGPKLFAVKAGPTIFQDVIFYHHLGEWTQYSSAKPIPVNLTTRSVIP